MPVPLLVSPALGAIGQVRHGFTTRDGGVSVGPRESLDLGSAGPADARQENWTRVAEALGATADSLALIRQVHGAEVAVVVEPGGPERPVAVADGAVTVVPGILLAVRVADCVPVLLAAPGGVGVAHAGWRGVATGVVPATVAALCALAACSPADLVAAVGPHAEVGRYEVGPEVIDALTASGLPREVVARMGDRGREHADLRAATAAQLAVAGVRVVDHVAGDTLSDRRFFSHRLHGDQAGRQAGVIGWFGP